MTDDNDPSLLTGSSERLQEARRLAGFVTASDAARFHGWNENTYRSHENGERGLKGKVAERYARAFKVGFLWLLQGYGNPHEDFTSSFFGYVSEDCNIHVYGDERQEQAVLPVSVPTNARCIFINHNRFYPRYEYGDLLLCWPSKKDDEYKNEIGDFINSDVEGIVWLSEDELILGRIFGDGDSGVRVELQGVKPIRQHSILAFAPVEIVIRAKRYAVGRRAKR